MEGLCGVPLGRRDMAGDGVYKLRSKALLNSSSSWLNDFMASNPLAVSPMCLGLVGIASESLRKALAMAALLATVVSTAFVAPTGSWVGLRQGKEQVGVVM